MRYSDDMIIIIPKNKVSSVKEIWQEIQSAKEEYPYLQINAEKTCVYAYLNKKVSSIQNEITGTKKCPNFISFLGFSFNGKYIRFRDKTLTKFFYKLYRKIDSMIEREKNRIEKNKKRKSKIDKKQILKLLKASSGETRKFIDYVQHAKRVYPNEKYIAEFKKNTIEKIFVRFEKRKIDNLN